MASRLNAYLDTRKLLGVGTFCKVTLGVHKATRKHVAIKIAQRKKLQKLNMTEKLRTETHILRLFQHPHVIRLYEVIDTPECIYSIMEYVPNGELFDYIVEQGKLEEARARELFQQIISGVQYCHMRSVVHRDLKPENLLLDANNRIKIADFGLSNFLRDGRFLKTSCGSPNYAAPEVISGTSYAGPEVDVWSCGVILYAMLCGNLPFDDENIRSLFQKIKSGAYNEPSHVSPLGRDLLRRLLTVNPLKRITLRDVRKHKWFADSIPRYLRVSPEHWIAQSLELDLEIARLVVKLKAGTNDNLPRIHSNETAVANETAKYESLDPEVAAKLAKTYNLDTVPLFDKTQKDLNTALSYSPQLLTSRALAHFVDMRELAVSYFLLAGSQADSPGLEKDKTDSKSDNEDNTNSPSQTSERKKGEKLTRTKTDVRFLPCNSYVKPNLVRDHNSSEAGGFPKVSSYHWCKSFVYDVRLLPPEERPKLSLEAASSSTETTEDLDVKWEPYPRIVQRRWRLGAEMRKSPPKIMNGLLAALEECGFVWKVTGAYKLRVRHPPEILDKESGDLIDTKLILKMDLQLYLVSRSQGGYVLDVSHNFGQTFLFLQKAGELTMALDRNTNGAVHVINTDFQTKFRAEEQERQDRAAERKRTTLSSSTEPISSALPISQPMQTSQLVRSAVYTGTATRNDGGQSALTQRLRQQTAPSEHQRSMEVGDHGGMPAHYNQAQPH